MRQLPLQIELRADASFDSFVAEHESVAMLLFQLQMAIMRNQSGSWYLHGPDGSGKTHLLQAACRFAHQWERRCVYLDLADSEINAWPALLNGLEESDVIALDAVDAVIKDTAWQVALASLLRQAADHGRVMLMAGQIPLVDWPVTEPVLAEQLSAVVPVSLQPVTEPEAQMLALQRHGQLRGLKLPKSVVKYLIRTFDHDLEAALLALQHVERASLIEKRRITLPFVKQVLAQPMGA